MNCGKILVLTALVVWCAGCGGDKKFGSSNDDTFVDLRVEQGVEITYDGNANDKADLVDNDITSIWTDPSTGLMWQRHALPDRRTQASAKQYCQALTLAGYSDWQLPTVQELRTIQGCPATATEGPCRMDVLLGLSEDVCWHGGGCLDPSPNSEVCYLPPSLAENCAGHWSSSLIDPLSGYYRDESGSTYAWWVGFVGGGLAVAETTDDMVSRCVRRDAPCTPVCKDKACGDGGCFGMTDYCGNCGEGKTCSSGQCIEETRLWEDSTTGLMWQNPPEGYRANWPSAQHHCENLVFAGYNDWRLPSIAELRSIIHGCPQTESSGTCNVALDDCMCWNCANESCDGCLSQGDCYWKDGLEEAKEMSSYSGKMVTRECGRYWSATLSETIVGTVDNGHPWLVSFRSAAVTMYLSAEGYRFVRCVR